MFSDVVLAGKSGVELAEEISSLSPSTPVLLTSGYTDDRSQLVEIRKRELAFLQKPYALGDLLVAVGEPSMHKRIASQRSREAAWTQVCTVRSIRS